MQNIEDIYELSPMQHGMLYHAIYAPEDAAYFEQTSCVLRGTLNLTAFQQAWQQVIDRHPVLRTSFHWENLEKPVQVVHQHVDFAWQVEDWQTVPAQEQSERLQAFLHADRQRGFDLTTAPLLRCALMRIAPQAWYFVWSHHHILFDGWSRAIILNDVFTLYDLAQRGQPLGLANQLPAIRHYRDYIVWLQAQDHAAAQRFWEQCLQGVTAPTIFDIKTPLTQSSAGHAETERRLSPNQTKTLHTLAQRYFITLNTLVQGAWVLLLQRYANTDDVIVGMTVSGRPPEVFGSDRMVGLFINTLPLRVHLDPTMRVMDWLKQMQAQQAEQDRFAYTPLADIQTWSDIPRGTALFDHVFTFENYPIDETLQREQFALQIQDVEYAAWTNYPLSVLIAPGAELTLKLIYDRQRFDAETICRMADHFVNALTAIAAQPEQRLMDVPILSPAEQQQILTTWNQTRQDFAADACLHELIENQSDKTPEAVAVSFEETTLTYRELERRANQLARHLQALGVKPDVVVGLCLERSIELVVALLGVLKAGGAYLPLDPDYPPERMRFILTQASAAIVLTVSRLRERLPAECRQVVCLDANWRQIATQSPERPASGVHPEHVAYVLYTSGSTGAPKGVMIPHRAICNHMRWMADAFPLTSADNVFQKTPYSFDASIWEFYAPLMAGAQLVMARPGGHQDPVYLTQTIQAQQITILQLVPSVLNILLETPGVEACASLRRVFCGGEALTAALRDRFFAALPAELINLYGPTETAIDTLFWQCRRPDASTVVPIGRPIANVQAYILNRHFQPVPAGIPGDLYLSGASLARGYLGRPDLTAERFLPNPFGAPFDSAQGDGHGERSRTMYATGDVAAWQPDGSILYFGRRDQQIKLRGFRIELGEIETALRDSPDVRDAVVIVREDQPSNPKLVAYVIPHTVESFSETALRQALRARLPEYMTPSAFVALSAFPLTSHGKVDRRQLPAPEQRTYDARTHEFGTPTAAVVESIWAHVLGVERLGATADFFDLGGHSLSAMQVLARVREIFQIDIPLRTLFEAPRLTDFAARIDAARTMSPDRALSSIQPTDRNAPLPLSFAQERLWFLQQLVPDNPFYTIPMAVRWQGTLDEAILIRALDEIVRRHEALRTTFTVIDVQPRQVIHPPAPVTIKRVDLRHLSADAQTQAITEQINTIMQQTFDLTRLPLYQFTLIRLQPTETVLAAVMHHIVTDGWSISVFVRELSALYQAFGADQPSPLPELAVQYADFAVWQREWLQGDILAQQRQYWRQQLRGAPQIFELPADYPRPPLQTFRGRMIPLRIAPSVASQLRAVSQQVGASLYMTLLTGLAILLTRSTWGVSELLVGAPIANRTRHELEPLIGFFVNTLALRLDVSGNPTVEDLLLRIRQTALDAYAHQDLPFEQVVEELQPTRDLSRNPLAQVSLVYQNLPVVETDVPGGKLIPFDYAPETVRFDLEVHVWDAEDGGLAGSCLYYADLFAAATIERLMARFTLVLEIMGTWLERRISELPLMTTAEREQLLTTWNPQDKLFPIAASLQSLVEQHAAQTPDAIAVTYPAQPGSSATESALTYRELNRRANQLAHALRARGVKPETLVGVFLDRSPNMIAALLGILKAGGAYVPIEPKQPVERVAFLLADAQVPIVITTADLADRLPVFAGQIFCMDTESAQLDSESAENPRNQTTPDHAAYVIYTSGSTGTPKGVVVTHGNVLRLFRATDDWYHFDRRDVWSMFHSYAFDFSVWEIWGALLYGGRLVLVSYDTSRTPEFFYTLLHQEQVTVLNQTPSAFRQLMQAETQVGQQPLALRFIIFGGEALDLPSVQPWFERHGDQQPQLVNMYGITETTVHVTYRPLTKADAAVSRSVIGVPIPDLQCYVLDQWLQPVPVGVPGELCVGGAGLARGYLHRPELTAERFAPNPFTHPFPLPRGDSATRSLPSQEGIPIFPSWEGEGVGRLYRSGDLARYLPNGDLEYLGRIDQQVKIRGFRIEPGEIEAVLGAFPDIATAAVLPHVTPSGEKELVAYVAPKSGKSIARRALRQFLKERLPEYMLPAALVELEALPLNANGKLDRRALPAPQARQWDDAEATLTPRTPTEAVLQNIWAAILHQESIGLQSDFFEVGGHSLLATQVISRIREVFQVELPLRQIFETPTIAGLAEALDRMKSAQQGVIAPRITPVAHDAPLPLSFAQERLWFLEQLVPGNPFYNTPLVVELHGQLDYEACKRTLNALVERHETLRTTFTTLNGQPRQVIHPPYSVALPVNDVSALPEDVRAATARQYAWEEGRRSFDLTQGPLLRATLVRLNPTEHWLLLTMHHIVSDGWSLGVLLRELTTLYAAFAQSETPALPALMVQYADFAVWQRGWLRDDALARQMSYWRTTLNGAPFALELPIDFARPPVHTFRGQAEPFMLTTELTARLKRLSQEAGASLYMTVLSAFAVLLARYADVDDLLVSSPIANRTRQELEPLIGFFVNTLALRMNLRGNPTFAELLRRVRQTTLDAYAHQDVPFEQLVEEFQPERDMSRTPLVQVSLAYQNAPVSEVDIPGLTLNPLALESGTVRFDLEVHVWEDPSGALTGSFMYYADIFEPATIRRMIAHFTTLLTGIAADPEQPIANLPLLSADEYRQLIETWNMTDAPYPRTTTFAQLFTAQAAHTPAAIAVIAGQERLTYWELNERANQLAHHLRALGVGPDVLVGLCVERSVAMLVGLLGILKAGGAYVPLDPAYPQERLMYMTGDAHIRVLVTQQQFRPLFAAQEAALLCVDTDWQVIAQSPATNPAVTVLPEHLAYVIYTSGSTGKPKGTLIPHQGMMNYLHWCTQAYRVADGQGAPVHSSIGFDATITSVFAPLMVGRKVVLLPEKQEIEALRDVLLAQEDFSVIKITPAHLEMLSQLVPAQRTTGQVRSFIIGGEALLGKMVAFWQTYMPETHLINEYGPTETVVGCCVFDAQGTRPFPGPVPIGRPIANTQLYILDRNMTPVPIGVYGELYIGGDGLARGYLNRPDVTAEKFVPNPFTHPCPLPRGETESENPLLGGEGVGRLYRTSDVARYLPDGNIEYRGRCDHQVKIRGYRIEPGEIESLLAAHPAVKDVIVAVREDQPDDKRLTAYIVPAAEEQADRAEAAVNATQLEQVSAWQQVFQDSYSHPSAGSDVTFDITGWNSSYTGLPLPASEMREWVEQTVARILELQPQNVLEIGCGTGLLLSRIAPNCQTYWGADFSQVALRHVQQMKTAFAWGDRVTLLHRPADDFSGLADGQFDVVLLNSVIQYFPSVEYLLQVIQGALRVLRPGGAIFLGDLRSLPLLEAYHASVQMTQAAADMTAVQLRQQIQQRMFQEEELVIDPELFAALPQSMAQISRVNIQYKRGQAVNELTKFRYDVMLTVGASPESTPEIDWRDESETLSDIRAVITAAHPVCFGVHRLANARLSEEVAMLTWLREAAATETVSEFRQRQSKLIAYGVDLEQLWQVGAECGYHVQIVPTEGASDGSVTAIFQTQDAASLMPYQMKSDRLRPWKMYANNPLRRKMQRKLIPELREYLAAKVPEYMIPAAYMLLDAFPLTPHGKVDRRALPAPDSAASVMQEGYRAPQTPTEAVVAAIWADVLNLERVGLQDNFFHLGGHSLLATQVISRLRDAFAVELPVRQMFETPTVAEFSARLETLKQEQQHLPVTPPIVSIARTAQLPLSFAQERLWFLDQLEGPNATYNSPVAVRLTGQLDIPALEQSLTMIGNRHETLRTTFSTTADGQPVQIIAPNIRITLPVFDIQTGKEQDRIIQTYLAEEAAQPFDLAQGPLLRGKLLRLSDEDHVLLLNMHHIVSDGWSTSIFVREFAAIYTALLTNTPVTLPALPIQYADFAIWQRQWLQGETLAAQLAYWQAQLREIPPLLELPTDHPRPAAQTFRGSSCAIEIDAALTKHLNALSQRAGVSLFMTLLAAFATLLSRYSGADDLVIGSPIANRNRREIEPLIGFFVNTLALRIDLSGQPNFFDLLARVRQTALDAYAHQDVPFEVVVEAIQPERHLSHHPVFQTMFVLQNTPAERLELPNLTLTPIQQEQQTAKFDLLLSFMELEDRLTGWLEYSTDLFDAATIQRMLGHLTRLLKEIAAAPERPLTQLPLLTDAERQQIMRWNQTTQPVPPFCIAQMFEQQAARTPDAIALEFPQTAGGENQQLTYRELNDRANRLAHHLRQQGAKPDVPIGVCLERSIDLLVAVLAILKADSPYLPLDPTYPPERLAMMQANAGAPLIITQAWLTQERAAIARHSAENLNHQVTPDHLAYIIYTSGSTGIPKGVAMRQRALTNLIYWQIPQSAATVGTKTLQFTSLSFDVSFQEIFATWCSGGRLVQIADDLRRDSRALLQVLITERIERLFLPFVALQQLALSAQEEGVVPTALREIITAGEQLQISSALRWLMTQLPACRLHNQYGPAESHVVTAYTLTGAAANWNTLPPIGTPIANTQIFLFDAAGEPVPVGVPGELHIGGDCLARGYIGRPDLTAEKFVPNPFNPTLTPSPNLGEGRGGVLYRTGDLARYLPDGNIEFLGRRDQQVKIRGFRVEPGEIESVLTTHPDIQEAAVITQTTPEGFKRLVAYLVPNADKTLNMAEIRHFVKTKLPEYMTPSIFAPLAQLPLTPSGKVNRRALPSPDSTGQLMETDRLIPRDAVELQLARIWEQVLERSPVGVHDNFFDLGGHSLLAVRLMAHIHRQFGLHLPLATLFQHPTVAQLAELLRRQTDAASWQVLVPIRLEKGGSPFFCIPGAGGNVVYFAELARHSNRPFYGLQAIGLDGVTPPQTRIQEIAATYIEAIQAVQPHGPYWLGGHSFGGWVAFEMAQQLQRQGQTVAVLVIFDTPAPPRQQPLHAVMKDDAEWLAEIASVIGSMFGKTISITTERLQSLTFDEQLAMVHHALKDAEILPPDTDLRLLRGFVQVYKAHVNAMTHYVAPDTIFATPIRLIRAQDVDPLTGQTAGGQTTDKHLGWSEFAAESVETMFVSGDHRTMLNSPHVEAVAQYVRVWLNEE